jgi:beta-lactamase regulating signal transducer with metallopeptidase domain
MIEHLVVSTLILGVGVAAARLLPLQPRTRAALLLCALMKFLVPSNLLTILGVHPAPAAAKLILALSGGASPAAAMVASGSGRGFVFLWVFVSTLLALHLLVRRHRFTRALLASASAPDARELAALKAAAASVGLRAAPLLIRSDACDVPSVVGIVGPRIVIPPAGVAALDDAELSSLFGHECAHVARRDNLVSLAVALLRATLFWHPLVWLAERDLHVASEEACDVAAARSSGVDVYVAALRKLTFAAVVAPIATVSCAAGANLTNRLEELMRTNSRRSISHSLALAVAIFVIAGGTFAAADPSGTAADKPYTMSIRVMETASHARELQGNIADASGTVAAKIALLLEQWPTEMVATTGDGTRFAVHAEPHGGTGNLIGLRVYRGSTLIEDTSYLVVRKAQGSPAASVGSGETISLQLKDAEINDLLHIFAQLGNKQLRIAQPVAGKVSIEVQNTAWTEALQHAASKAGIHVRIEGDTIVAEP